MRDKSTLDMIVSIAVFSMLCYGINRAGSGTKWSGAVPAGVVGSV
jgi:hypothetical protein